MLCILINKSGYYGEVIKATGWVDCLIGGRCKEPFVLPNVNRFAISNMPPCALPNYFEATMDTMPSMGAIAAQLGIDNIRKWEISCLVNS